MNNIEENKRIDWVCLLNKFSPEMKDKLHDPLVSSVFNALLKGDDPYIVIESLIKVCEDSRQKILELYSTQKIQYVLPVGTKLFGNDETN